MAPTLALKLPLMMAFILAEFQLMFKCHGYATLPDFDKMLDDPPEWHSCTVLASSSNEYLSCILPKLRSHEGPFIFATDLVFKNCRRQDVLWLLRNWATLHKQQGLCSSLVAHANFGRVSSGVHLVSYWLTRLTCSCRFCNTLLTLPPRRRPRKLLGQALWSALLARPL